MIENRTYGQLSLAAAIGAKWQDYKQLVKLRLNLMVVLSTFFGYLLGCEGVVDWGALGILLAGGFLTVGAANGINQIIERESDRKMTRTENRPLAQYRMSVAEATIASMLMGLVGVVLITTYLNELAGLLSLVSLCLYGFLYTPLKRVSSFAVHIGAVPGALPPIIGYVAAAGVLDTLGWLLFALQFVWQLPHFYAIAWLLDEDYRKAGLKMMPVGTGKDKGAALQIMIFTGMLVPISFLPAMMGYGSWWSAVLLAVASGWFLGKSISLYKTMENKDAKQLMFASFFYLPVMFLIFLTDKLI